MDAVRTHGGGDEHSPSNRGDNAHYDSEDMEGHDNNRGRFDSSDGGGEISDRELRAVVMGKPTRSHSGAPRSLE